MILDEKSLMYPPPPPYSTPPSSLRRSFTSLPPHILLEIIADTFPRESTAVRVLRPGTSQYDARLYEPTNPEEQRKVLFWLSTSLRLVNRQMYAACMYILRSTYLQAYQALIRSPYTSDPFPLSSPSPSNNSNNDAPPSSPTLPSGPPAYASASTTSLSSFATAPGLPPSQWPSPFAHLPRETPILDRFIVLKVRHDVLADESELHCDREDAFRDVFDVAQPRARLEDLVRVYGLKAGVVSVPSETPTSVGEERGGLPTPPTSPTSPTSPSTHRQHRPHQPQQTQTQTQTQPQSKKRPGVIGSFFSFKRSSPTPSVSSHSSGSSTTTSSSTHRPHPQRKQITPIPFASLSVSFSPRRVGLVYNRTRTIAEIAREGPRKESLEVLARRLVGELRGVLEAE